MKSTFIILLSTLSFLGKSQTPHDVNGLWLVASGDAHVEVYERSGKYYGKITWLKEPYDKEGRPQKDPEGRDILFMEIMKDFVFEEDEWVDGSVYDAETGKTYHGTMELEGSNKLKLRGSIDSFGLLGRTETWTRVKNE